MPSWESEFSLNDIKRYSRQIIAPKFEKEGQRLISAAKVLIVGAGGLGSPVLMYLAGSGVGKIGVADYDCVDLTNLQRQVIYKEKDIGRSKSFCAKKFVEEINSSIEVDEVSVFLDFNNVEETIKGYDIVVDCCDSIPLRYILNDACRVHGKRLVCGSVLKWEGQILVVNREDACYRCIFPEMKTSAPNCNNSGVVGSVCGTVGSIMATEVIKMILASDHNKSQRAEENTLIIYNAYSSDIKRIRKVYKPCEVCLNKVRIFIDSKKMCCSVLESSEGFTLNWKNICERIDEFRIYDIRKAVAFDIFRVKGSINIVPDDLLKEDFVAGLKKSDGKVIISCYKGRSSKSVVTSLRKVGIDAFSAEDGIEGFKKFINFDSL